MTEERPYGRDLAQSSLTGGVVIVTMPDPAADISPDSQPCKSCLVQQKEGTGMNMTIFETCTANKWELSTTTAIPVPVTNLDQLHFYGTAGDTIQIMWRGD
jgi:hypothetical protein